MSAAAAPASPKVEGLYLSRREGEREQESEMNNVPLDRNVIFLNVS